MLLQYTPYRQRSLLSPVRALLCNSNVTPVISKSLIYVPLYFLLTAAALIWSMESLSFLVHNDMWHWGPLLFLTRTGILKPWLWRIFESFLAMSFFSMCSCCHTFGIWPNQQTGLGKTSENKNRKFSELGIICLSTYPPPLNCDDVNSDNWTKMSWPTPPVVVVTNIY